MMASAKPYLMIPGDPCGVGPEVIASWLGDTPGIGNWAIAGPEAWVESLAKTHPEHSVEWIPRPGERFVPGQPGGASARFAWETLQWAAQACREGTYAGLLTGPVCKETLVAEGFAFPGQTEFLGDAWKGEPSMAFWGESLKVVLATWHIPLKAVPSALSERVIGQAVERASLLGQLAGHASPRIAVCGLNPHAGENGLLGTEERDWIGACLQNLTAVYRGLEACPQPADTVFWNARKGNFDTVVALYHDQGLGPLKTLEFHTACQITLGLPHLRTSPDHGTAFGLAGQGKADARSIARAVLVMEQAAPRLAKIQGG